jgi:hypothetical protein
MSGNECDAGRQPGKCQRGNGDCGKSRSQLQRAVFGACEIVFLRLLWSAIIRECLMSAMQAGNDVGDDGAKAIAASLEVNSSVQRLYLVRFLFDFFLLHFLCAYWCWSSM